MEVLGMFGFTFGMMAFVMVTSLQSEVKKLKQEVAELKLKLLPAQLGDSARAL